MRGYWSCGILIRVSGVHEFDGECSALAHDIEIGERRNYAAKMKLEDCLNFISHPPAANVAEKPRHGQVRDIAEARERHVFRLASFSFCLNVANLTP